MCHSIKGLTNIVSLDFSNCGLTSRGAVAVAETLKVGCILVLLSVLCILYLHAKLRTPQLINYLIN